MLLPLLLAAAAMPADLPSLRASCPAGSGPAMLVDVTGFRDRRGQVRVRLFGGASSTWFDKKHWVQRLEVPVPASGPVRFCIPVPRPGTYAVDIRHDGNGNGDTDRADGGGASGNPQLGLFDVMFGRKPDVRRVGVQVGSGVTNVPITLMYLQGGKFRPIR